MTSKEPLPNRKAPPVRYRIAENPWSTPKYLAKTAIELLEQFPTSLQQFPNKRTPENPRSKKDWTQQTNSWPISRDKESSRASETRPTTLIGDSKRATSNNTSRVLHCRGSPAKQLPAIPKTSTNRSKQRVIAIEWRTGRIFVYYASVHKHSIGQPEKKEKKKKWNPGD